MAAPPRKVVPVETVREAVARAVARVRAELGVTVPPELVLAIIDRESYPRYNTNSYRREPDGRESFGLMQVLVDTARWMGFAGQGPELYDPFVGVYWGTRYLGYQLKRYAGDVTKAVAAYNAGTAKQRADGSWITTEGYVPFVLGRVKHWAAALGKLAGDNPGATALVVGAVIVAALVAGRGRG